MSMKRYRDTIFKVSSDGVVFGKQNRPLSKRTDTKGYIRHPMRINGKVKEYYVHQMVWDLYGNYSREGLQVNHKNGIKTDNRIENLEAVTASENIKHAHKLGLIVPVRNQKHPKCKIDDQKVIEIRVLIKKGESNRFIAKKYGCHHGIIQRIRSGKKKLTTEN